MSAARAFGGSTALSALVLAVILVGPAGALTRLPGPWANALEPPAASAAGDPIRSTALPLASNYSLERLLPTGDDPAGPMLYDPQNSEIYVPNLESSNLSVVDAASGTLLPSIALPAPALGLALDPANGRLFAPEGGTSGIAVIDTANDSVVATLPWGTQNGLPAYDPANGELYVGEEATGNVLVLNATSETVVTTVATGDGALDPVPDPSAGVVFVTNPGAGTVSVLSAQTNALTDQIHGLPGADGGAIDPANGWLAVGHLGNASIGLVPVSDPVAPGVVQSVPVDAGDPEWPEFFPALGGMFVPTGVSVGIVAEGTAREIASFARGSGAASVAYDPHGRTVYVTEPSLDEVAIYQVGPEVFPLTVRESGLPTGTNWTATVNRSTALSRASTISQALPNGTYAFGIGPITEPNFSAYAPVPMNGTVRVNGTAVDLNVSFSFVRLCNCTAPRTNPGLSSGDWLLIVLVAGALTGGVAVAGLRFLRPKPPPPGPVIDATYRLIRPEAVPEPEAD